MNGLRPMSYYNEIDPFAAEWLRNLISAGAIAKGLVDERSIEDVTPNDLQGFTQCHFFAGVGVWSHSLRLAGWPDNRAIWTGSCPCQPFSTAGRGAGFTDQRHLWPAFYWLISQCQPQHVFGEQVAASDANTWFDLVQADLEGLGYAFGLVPFTSAGVGAPHIRDRAYWVAHSRPSRLQGREQSGGSCAPQGWQSAERYSGAGRLAGRMADASGQQCEKCNSGSRKNPPPMLKRGAKKTSGLCVSGPLASVSGNETDGYWKDPDWLLCRDGKWRPVRSGASPLANGLASALGRLQPDVVRMARRNRTGRIKGYGNALNAVAATAFIRAFLDMEIEGINTDGVNQ